MNAKKPALRASTSCGMFAAPLALASGCLLVLLAARPLKAQDELSAKLLESRQVAGASKGWSVVGSLGAGVGQFQDIQVPIGPTPEIRADGKAALSENTDHFGLPLQVSLGVTWRGDAVTSDVSADFLVMRASSGPAETQSSSYSRAAVGTSLRWQLNPGAAYAPYIGGRLESRRSSFNNVSTGHYVSALITRLELGLDLPSSRLEAFASYAPVADFGYSSNTNFMSGKRFTGAKTTLLDAGLRSSLPVSDSVLVDLGIEREMIRVHINDVGEYDSFGLTVGRYNQQQRAYSLNTSIVKVGFRKSF